MKYDIYFHNDFDGRASAAVMLAFLRGRGDDIEHFVPVDFYLEKEWMEEDFFSKNKLVKGRHNPAVIVDFLYNPGAKFWFDHHPTSIRKKEWIKRFRPSKYFVLSPEQPSCAHAVMVSLKRNFGWRPSGIIRDLVSEADVIDSAAFSDLRRVIELGDAGTVVEAFIEVNMNDRKLAKRMVELMASRPLVEIAALPEVKRTAAMVRISNLRALDFYRKHMSIEGNASFIDLTAHPEMMRRFAPFYLEPGAAYAVRFTKKSGEYKISVSRNQWRKGGAGRRAGIHIGKFLDSFGGGGHKGAGGANFPTRAKAEAALPAIMKKFGEARG